MTIAAELNSRLNFTPAESGDYVLRVSTFSEDGRGAYAARVENAAAAARRRCTAPGSRR